MDLRDKRVGFAVTGSHCTLSDALQAMQRLVEAGANVWPILSYTVDQTDTRFFKAADFRASITQLTGREPIRTIVEAEPIGPQKMFDLMVVAPCTGNTLAKFVGGIVDTPVLMAVKAHLRNGRPVVLAIATNDALSNNARNVGAACAAYNVFMVPYAQDDAFGKPNSLVARMELLNPTCEAALDGRQLQPMLYNPAALL